MLKKSFLSLLSGFMLVGCSVIGIEEVDEPPYQVLKTEGVIEIRQYQPMIMAVTEIEISPEMANRDLSGIGFRRLAGYIFGGNQSQKKIAMTAPVLQETQAGKSEKIAMTAPVLQETQGDLYRMAFVMPEKYTLNTLPKPLDPKVKLELIPSRKVATIQFSGFWDEATQLKHTQKLQAWLKTQNYESLSQPRSAAYNSPWSIPAFRRNEVHIDIK